MAKYIMWFLIIVIIVDAILSYNMDGEIGYFPQIMFVTFVSVLALCESIEKRKG